MSTLANRIMREERRRGVGDRCSCCTLEILYEDGTIENEAPPLCPHGQPWALIRQYDLRGGGNDRQPVTGRQDALRV